MGKLHLVDLAGSERVSMSGATGSTLREAQSINRSLSTLGDVLSAVSKAQKRLFKGKVKSPPLIPYRNSKLTTLLKDSLGGNSRTLMITTIRSTTQFYHQTRMSLTYSSRAKKIRLRSVVNEVSASVDEEEFRNLKLRLQEAEINLSSAREEIADLSHRLASAESTNDARKEEVSRHVARLQASVIDERERHAAKEVKLQKELDAKKKECHEKREKLQRIEKAVSSFSVSHEDLKSKLEHAEEKNDEYAEKLALERKGHGKALTRCARSQDDELMKI